MSVTPRYLRRTWANRTDPVRYSQDEETWIHVGRCGCYVFNAAEGSWLFVTDAPPHPLKAFERFGCDIYAVSRETWLKATGKAGKMAILFSTLGLNRASDLVFNHRLGLDLQQPEPVTFFGEIVESIDDERNERSSHEGAS